MSPNRILCDSLADDSQLGKQQRINNQCEMLHKDIIIRR